MTESTFNATASCEQADTDAAITATLALLTRETVWYLVGELPLRFDAYHPQGMVRIGSEWWISTVDIERKRGFILKVDEGGNLVEQIPVGDGDRYHPGGMDFDGNALWIPLAEYRPDSTATIYRMVPGDSPERAFGVDDHVGGIARCGAGGDLVGWSWGSRRFYRWTVDGDLRASTINPSFFVDHQDCHWLNTGHLLCGGVSVVTLADGVGQIGGLGLLNVTRLVMEREVPFPFYSLPSRRVATENPIFAEERSGQLVVHLLPEDGLGTIVSYSTQLAAQSAQLDRALT